ncbi:hypothetical protein [Microbacterium lacticum]
MANATNTLVGRSVGHEWAVSVATSGHFCWPPTGSSYWPLTDANLPRVDPGCFDVDGQLMSIRAASQQMAPSSKRITDRYHNTVLLIGMLMAKRPVRNPLENPLEPRISLA